MKAYLFLITFFSLNCLNAVDLEICLATKQRNKTLYLANNQYLKNEYQKKLVKIFTSALKFNQEFYFATNSNTSEFWAHHKDRSMALNQERWHLRGIEYLLIPKLNNDYYEVTLYNVCANQSHEIHSEKLTHNIQIDRYTLLKLADKISQILLHKPSVVSKKILFCRKGSLFTMTYDGKQIQKVETGHHDCTTPANIGESGQFIFTSFDQGQSKIIHLKEGQDSKPIIKLRGNQMLPAISKKTNCIAYICDAASRADLYIQPFNAAIGAFKKPIQLFAKNGSVQSSPTFHPGGTKLVFVSDKSGQPDIYMINLLKNKGNKCLPKATSFITKTKNNTSPAFSNCGKYLAYLSKINGTRQVWVFNFKTKESKQITFDVNNKESPCFSPCSQYILYNTSSSDCNIFLIGLESKQVIQLTNKGDCQYAVFID